MKLAKLLAAVVLAFVALGQSTNVFGQISVGAYHGLFSETNGMTHHSAGYIKINFKLAQKFSGKLIFDGDTIVFSSTYPTNLVLQRTKFGKDPVVISIAENPLSTQEIIGTISNANWVAEILAFRQNFAPLFVNNFTMVLPGDADASVAPGGDSFGYITNNATGFSKVAGYLADGQLAPVKLPISTNGLVGLYCQLYRSFTTYTNDITHFTDKVERLGSLQGWINFNTSSNVPSGTLHWSKAAIGPSNIVSKITSNYYALGFSKDISVVSSLYTVPSLGSRGVNITNGMSVAQDGNLASPFTNHFFLNTNNLFTFSAPILNYQKITSFKVNNGFLSGYFLHPDNDNLLARIKGVVLQNQEVGRGYFLGADQSGSVRLQNE